MASIAKTPRKKITRSDLEAKFREIQDDVQGKVDANKATLKTAAIAGGVVVLLLVYMFGRRSGRKKTTLVEIRRV